MHLEKWICRPIKNQLNYSGAHLNKAREMLLAKSPPEDVYCQLKALEGGIKKTIYTLLPDALRQDLIIRIHRLLNTKPICPEQVETLKGIQKELSTQDPKKLLRLGRELTKFEN